MTEGGGAVVPGPGNQRALRDAFGRFATGVTVVTAAGSLGPVGITANSFASVSLDPPLLLWAPARASRRFPPFAVAEAFAVHVLGADQSDLGRRFAAAGGDWAGLAPEVGPEGVPLLAGALARFECTTEARHPAGDHLIIIGRIRRFAQRPGPPLLFAGGCYGGFALP
ncbi:MAG: flavin reductase family protein [Rhodobacteraceae bacterium]|nr:flavin reductase family protein [Paracoccaceae bacterium]